MTGGLTLPPPGAHGGDGPAVARALGLAPEAVVDLSQNMNPFAPDVIDLVQGHLDALYHYPDPRQAQESLAGVLEVHPDRVIVTNGGAEAIRLVAAAYGGHPRSEPEFSLHPRGVGGPVWRSNPHSPSGQLADESEQADVWDEAFYPLATGRWTARRSGIVVGSLTKTFTCPGLRLGYVLLGADQDPEELRRHQPHWAVNALALAALPEMLESADLPAWASQLADARRALCRLLAEHHLQARSGDAPWVLVSAADSPVDLRAELAPSGVVVRDCTSFGMPGTYRIAVPDSSGLERLRLALEHIAIRREHGGRSAAYDDRAL